MPRTKVCSKCKKRKLLAKFYSHKRGICGKRTDCKECADAKIREWRSKDPGYNRKQQKRYRRRKPEVLLAMAARRRAKARGLAFDLKPEDLLPLPTHCPVLGILLSVGDGMHNDGSYSVDRIHNDQGYVKGNVAVVSYKASRLKSDASTEELLKIAEFYKLRSSVLHQAGNG